MKNKFGIDKTNNVNQVLVKNILTKHSFLFVNDSTLTENIVSYVILHIKKSTSNLLNPEYRTTIKNEAKITEKTSSLTGNLFAFSETFDLHAKVEK